MLTINRERVEETRKMSKFVNTNFFDIREKGLDEVLKEIMAKIESTTAKGEKAELTEEEKAKEELRQRMEEVFKGNDFGCQEKRVKILYGLMGFNDPEAFLKASAKSSDFVFNPGQRYYAFQMQISTDNSNSHNYGLNTPFLMYKENKLSSLFKRNGRCGNSLNASSVTGMTRESPTADTGRLATIEEIDWFFDGLLLTAQTSPIEDLYTFESHFPILSGDLKRTMTRIFEVYTDGVVAEATEEA